VIVDRLADVVADAEHLPPGSHSTGERFFGHTEDGVLPLPGGRR
jgi:hypothetical protein